MRTTLLKELFCPSLTNTGGIRVSSWISHNTISALSATSSANRSYVVHIVMLRIVLEQAYEFQESWDLVFIDYETAFDYFNHVESHDAQSNNTIIC